jgi:hypothetical protein
MSNLSLSTAIRLGAMLKPQAFKALYETFPQVTRLMGQVVQIKQVVATCALGAAYDAIGKLDVEGYDMQEFPVLKVVACCPVGGCGKGIYNPMVSMNIEDVIPHLNDDHRWTRERIAGWVESIEVSREVTLVPELAHA